MAGKALGVLLAVAALLVAAARAAADGGDDKAHPWKCFRSCAKDCHHHHHDNDSATVATGFSSSGPGDDARVSAVFVSAVTAECKNGCQEDECFKDLPAISHRQCAIATCLSHSHHSRKTTACLKDCCEKCFRKKRPPAPGPPAPGPPEPSPPAPGPPAPEPGPTPPSPPN